MLPSTPSLSPLLSTCHNQWLPPLLLSFIDRPHRVQQLFWPRPTPPPPQRHGVHPLPQAWIRIDPLERDNNGTGWGEWLSVAHDHFADGSEPIYSYKRGLEDPPSANVSPHTFVTREYPWNEMFYRQIVCGEYADGGFTYSIADNHLTWDPVHCARVLDGSRQRQWVHHRGAYRK